MRQLGNAIKTTLGWLQGLGMLLLAYQAALHLHGQRQDPLLKMTAATLRLDQCEAVARGQIPEHPPGRLTPYPTLRVWFKENPFWLCRATGQLTPLPPATPSHQFARRTPDAHPSTLPHPPE